MVKCEDCGVDFESFVVDWGSMKIGSTFCDDCIEIRNDADKAKEIKRRQKHHVRNFNRICPEIYRESDPDLIPLSGPYERAQEWTFGDLGLVLHGSARQGKTRAFWALLRRLIVEEGRNVEAFTANAFTRMIEVSFTRDGGHDDLIRNLSTCKILAIDDLGKQRWTDRVECDLFDILEARTSNGRPTIWTTNFNGKALEAKFIDPETGAAFIGRLREFHQAIGFDPEEGGAN